jgi:hypothetical protein
MLDCDVSPPHGADEMKVEMTMVPGTFVEGKLDRIISEQYGDEAHVVLEMSIMGGGTAARVTLSPMDLARLVRLGGTAAAERVRDCI